MNKVFLLSLTLVLMIMVFSEGCSYLADTGVGGSRVNLAKSPVITMNQNVATYGYLMRIVNVTTPSEVKIFNDPRMPIQGYQFITIAYYLNITEPSRFTTLPWVYLANPQGVWLVNKPFLEDAGCKSTSVYDNLFCHEEIGLTRYCDNPEVPMSDISKVFNNNCSLVGMYVENTYQVPIQSKNTIIVVVEPADGRDNNTYILHLGESN